jgi:D,D-heptose 1,7-bisphosphate phosphatase
MSSEKPVEKTPIASFTRKAVFLDRDGVINAKLPENHYVTHVAEFEFFPGVKRALAILKRLGYLLILITNQRGVARGFMTVEGLQRVHDYMQSVLERDSAPLDAIYYCPHDVFENCSCRKPQPGMILKASLDLNVDLSASYMVGDSPKDILAGRNAGVTTVRISRQPDEFADFVFPNLLEFARYLEEMQKSKPHALAEGKD